MVQFEELPFEIRDLIYGHIYEAQNARDDEYIWYSDHTPTQMVVRGRVTPHCKPSGSFLKTCRMIHEEAAPHLYRQTDFFCGAPFAAQQWISTIGPKNAGFVRDARFETSFLSSDISTAGRKIAMETWATVLNAVPNLERLRLTESDSVSWSDMTFKQGRGSLADAFDNLRNLKRFTYLGTKPFDMRFLQKKPLLTSLDIPQVILLDSEYIDGISINEKFKPLEDLHALRRLALQSFGSREQNDGHGSKIVQQVVPLIEIAWHLKSCTQSVAKSLVERHAETLKYLALVMDSTAPLDEMPWMLGRLSNLTCLEIGLVDSEVIKHLPRNLQKLVLVLKDPNGDRLKQNFLHLRTTCPSLRLFDVTIYWHDTFRQPVDLVTPSPDLYHNAIRTLRSTGLDVRAVGCDPKRCSTDIHSDHTDQSGLIP